MNWRYKELTIWKPPEELPMSGWAEKSIILPPDAEEKGPYRLRRVPFFKFAIDAIQLSCVSQIAICKPAQIGGSYATYAIMFYYSKKHSKRVLYVLADEKTAEKVMFRRLRVLVDISDELRESPNQTRFTKTELEFSNYGSIDMAWASSVASLATFDYPIVVMDEVDKPGYYVTTKEASPVSLTIERTATVWNRKVVLLSTPSTDDGNITVELNACDVIFDWHIPCPYCGQKQPLRWSQKYAIEFPDGKYRAKDGIMHNLGEVIWEGGRRALRNQITNARYKCGECGELWNTVQKNQADVNGTPVPRTDISALPIEIKNNQICEKKGVDTELKIKIGLHVSRLYSLLGEAGSFPVLVADWVKCQDDFRKLQGFLNSTLAIPWMEVGIKTTESKVLERKCSLPPLIVPKEAVALTAGIDVQKHGFYFTVWAFSHGLESWLIHYGFVPIWEDVYDLVFDNAYQVQGTEQETRQIWRAAMDTGGGPGDEEGVSKTEEIYSWLRDNGRNVIWGIKGDARPRGQKIRHSILDKMPGPRGQVIRGGLVIYLLDTSQLKEDFFWRLSNSDNDPQPMHLHNETGIDFAKQILAEEKRRNKKGQWEWVVIYRENHYLDASIYAHAAADPQWAGGVRVLRAGMRPRLTPAPDKPDKPSDWFGAQRKGWLR